MEHNDGALLRTVGGKLQKDRGGRRITISEGDAHEIMIVDQNKSRYHQFYSYFSSTYLNRLVMALNLSSSALSSFFLMFASCLYLF